MFIQAGLITLALLLPTAASPVTEGLGSRVPFEKRDGVTTKDGWFDHKRAVEMVVRDRKSVLFLLPLQEGDTD